MRRTRRNIWRKLKLTALALAAASVVTGSAAAALPAGEMPPGYAPELEVEQALIAGDTESLRKAGLLFDDVNTTSDYQPLLRNAEVVTAGTGPESYRPLLRNAEAIAPNDRAVTVTASSDGGFEAVDAALGFTLGLALATACALCLIAIRGRTRMAHS